MAYFSEEINNNKERTKRGAGGLESHTIKSKFKKNDFVDMIIPSSLHDLSFILNQPLKSADD